MAGDANRWALPEPLLLGVFRGLLDFLTGFFKHLTGLYDPSIDFLTGALCGAFRFLATR